jgi:DNA-binding transcriptional LysR family regulator
MEWSDLRLALAVGRGGTLAAAAKSLGVDATTVSRRLARLERALDSRLFERGPDGALVATAAGAAALACAEAVEREVELLSREAGGRDAVVAGTVRVTSVPVLVQRLLVPAAGALLARHPELRLELVAEPRDLNLGHGEADVALRLARPTLGGRTLVTRRLAELHYAVYAAARIEPAAAEALPWIGYDSGMAELPQAEWTERALRRDPGDAGGGAGGSAGGLRVNDADLAYAAALAGQGRALLPCRLAEADPRLRRLEPAGLPEPPRREVWMLLRRDRRDLARIAAVVAWIDTLF